MAKDVVKVSGFKELDAALGELTKVTARNVLFRTAEKSMEPMREKMKYFAPYDAHDRDGDGKHLEDTMTTERVKAKRARGSVKYQASDGVEVMTGPAPKGKRARANAGWQEDGTSKMEANSYVLPAFDSEGMATVDRVRENLLIELDKTTDRIRKRNGL
ncbi:hypothetical protein [Sphingopyxis sp. 550A]